VRRSQPAVAIRGMLVVASRRAIQTVAVVSVVVLGAGCPGARVGGESARDGHRSTSTPRVLECPPGDGACATVRGALERVRGYIGEGCGAPMAHAYATLILSEEPVERYLMQALGDQETEIAALAARVLVDIGQSDVVARWCSRGHSGAKTTAGCRAASGYSAAKRGLRFDGRWEGRSGPQATYAASLDLSRTDHGVGGTFCDLDAHVCEPIREVQVSGWRPDGSPHLQRSECVIPRT
jgi:hypothetical protein